MTSEEIRKRFLAFFEKREHAIIPSASLVPENDPSVLFTTAGMQPLVPYLMGSSHPTGKKRITSVQKCVRTVDIDEVGDNTHLTFFEMLGNWSLGDYFKKEAITWSYEFLTSKNEGLGLDPKRLYVTVFEGNNDAPRDDEAYSVWYEIFVKAGLDPEKRIFFMDAHANWWSPGDNGPCGPDSEMFYDLTGTHTNGLTKEEFAQADEQQNIIEIWNDVFMEYEKKDGEIIGKLANQNVDTGSGLERITAVVQDKNNIYETDIFEPLLTHIQSITTKKDERQERIIADHMRASVFIIGDGIIPSNTDQGYILRRLLRRSIRASDALAMPPNTLSQLGEVIIQIYASVYPILLEKKNDIVLIINNEEQKFRKTLEHGMKEFEKLHHVISGRDAFILFSTYGFPFELTREIALENGIAVDENGFKEEMKKHQDISRSSTEGKFKGGLANTNKKTIMLHTVTHLMLAGLRKFLGDDVHQAGSNITEERTRFDFTYPNKVEREILDKVEDYVNEAIKRRCFIRTNVVSKKEAIRTGVEGSFWDKYPDFVTVYSIACEDGTIYSKELCGGPHVQNTENITGIFKIIKEEASSSGVRRIKAILE